jgi:hypothetical protein
MPFGILSLCTDAEPQTRDNFTEAMANMGQYIREAQYKTFLKFQEAGDANVGFVSTYDLRRAWYHPWLKIPAGERTARWALATQYGKTNLQWMPSKLVEMTVEPGRLVLHFDKAYRSRGQRLAHAGLCDCRKGSQLPSGRRHAPSDRQGRPGSRAVRPQNDHPHQSHGSESGALPICLGSEPDGQRAGWEQLGYSAADPAQRRLAD